MNCAPAVNPLRGATIVVTAVSRKQLWETHLGGGNHMGCQCRSASGRWLGSTAFLTSNVTTEAQRVGPWNKTLWPRLCSIWGSATVCVPRAGRGAYFVAQLLARLSVALLSACDLAHYRAPLWRFICVKCRWADGSVGAWILAVNFWLPIFGSGVSICCQFLREHHGQRVSIWGCQCFGENHGILQLLLKSPNERLLNVSDVGTSIF